MRRRKREGSGKVAEEKKEKYMKIEEEDENGGRGLVRLALVW